jgi:hypothetical protein
MSLNIVTVPIDVLPAVVPPAAGYLQLDACLDPEIKESYEFETYFAQFIKQQLAANVA